MDSNNKNYYRKIDDINDELQSQPYDSHEGELTEEEVKEFYLKHPNPDPNFLMSNCSSDDELKEQPAEKERPGVQWSCSYNYNYFYEEKQEDPHNPGIRWENVVSDEPLNIREAYAKCQTKHTSGMEFLAQSQEKDKILKLSGIERDNVFNMLNEVKDLRTLALNLATLADHLETKVAKFCRSFEVH